MLRFLDAGESHGLGIVTIIEGLPAGLMLGKGDIEHELSRRRLGYGRGSRMQLEKDEAEILSGVRLGLSLGSPIAVLVRNAESEKWRERMRPEGTRDVPDATSPRPGHADLAGAVKYGTRDLRDIIERSSARATVGRVITGACAKSFLIKLGISIFSHVLSIGSVRVKDEEDCSDPRQKGKSVPESNKY